jgi:hypothetical protein
MRDRLIELLDIIIQPGEKTLGDIADHFLANGVIVPKAKAGQTIYRCDFILHKVIDWTVVRIDIYEDEIVYCDDCFNVFTEDEIGEDVFLTKEEAEKALAERSGE